MQWLSVRGETSESERAGVNLSPFAARDTEQDASYKSNKKIRTRTDMLLEAQQRNPFETPQTEKEARISRLQRPTLGPWRLAAALSRYDTSRLGAEKYDIIQSDTQQPR